MNETRILDRKRAVGGGVVLESPGPNVSLRSYLADRPAHTKGLRATEIALDITIRLARPTQVVWPVFRDFNRWMNRYGFLWDGIPADNEDSFVYLGKKLGASDPKENADRPRTQYIVRKVIPEQLIYFDSLPIAFAGTDSVWTGHNLFSIHEHGQGSKVAVFMEHTWYSQTMGIEELRAIAKGELEAGVAFWRDYLIPDLISAVDSSGKQ